MTTFMKYIHKILRLILFSVSIFMFASISAFCSVASGRFSIGNMSEDIAILIAYVLLALLV